jgi:hypothetical protein
MGQVMTDVVMQTGEIVEPDDAWNRHQRIVNLRNTAEGAFLALGEQLYYFEKWEQYKEMGHETFEAYLADADVDIGQKTARRLIAVFERYVLELHQTPVSLLGAGYSKLYSAAKIVDENNVEEWIAKASSLSRSDLKKEISTHKTGKVEDEPVHTRGLPLAIILGAIKDSDQEWLLSEECVHYCSVMDLPYEALKAWAEGGCRSIQDILCSKMEAAYDRFVANSNGGGYGYSD